MKVLISVRIENCIYNETFSTLEKNSVPFEYFIKYFITN